MRQFILCPSLGTGKVSAATAGKGGFAYLDPATNELTFAAEAADFVKKTYGKEAYIALRRSPEQGGDVILPFYNNHFTYARMDYEAATGFTCAVVIPEVEAFLDYTIIVVEKGKKFNERNKWTFTVHTKATDDTTSVANKLAALVNNNPSVGVTAQVATQNSMTMVGLIAKKAGVDFNIVPADELIDATMEMTHAVQGWGSIDYIKDLADKACADAGFEYTYDEGVKLYPAYPLNFGSNSGPDDGDLVIFTLRFAEPRQMKTRDEVVHQIVQVAVDSSDADNFEAICQGLMALKGDYVTE